MSNSVLDFALFAKTKRSVLLQQFIKRLKIKGIDFIVCFTAVV